MHRPCTSSLLLGQTHWFAFGSKTLPPAHSGTRQRSFWNLVPGGQAQFGGVPTMPCLHLSTTHCPFLNTSCRGQQFGGVPFGALGGQTFGCCGSVGLSFGHCVNLPNTFVPSEQVFCSGFSCGAGWQVPRRLTKPGSHS